MPQKNSIYRYAEDNEPEKAPQKQKVEEYKPPTIDRSKFTNFTKKGKEVK